MPRPPRQTEPGVVYHVLNRRVMRLPIFEKPEDYAAFERVLADGLERPDAAELLAYCLMPNHWHLVVQAGRRTNLSTWMQWLTVTHTHRWHAHRQAVGEGPLYQGRFKSFPVEADEHFLRLCCYVEADPVRARLTRQAESWQWCSFAARRNRGVLLAKLAAWPVERPRNWGAPGEFRDGRRCVEGRAAEHQPRCAVRYARLAATNRRSAGPGDHTASSRPASQSNAKIILTPFFPFFRAKRRKNHPDTFSLFLALAAIVLSFIGRGRHRDWIMLAMALPTLRLMVSPAFRGRWTVGSATVGRRSRRPQCMAGEAPLGGQVSE